MLHPDPARVGGFGVRAEGVDGLTDVEAAARLERDGPNDVVPTGRLERRGPFSWGVASR